MDIWPPLGGVRTAWALAAAVVIVAAHAPAADRDSNADLAAIQVMHDVSLADAAKPLTELEDKYRKALEKRKTTAQDAGDLDGVLAFKAELDALDTGNQIVNPRNSGDLAKLRRIYQEHKAKLAPEVEAAVAKADKDYADQLNKLVTDLTKSGQTEEAVKVRVALDDFKEAQRAKRKADDSGLAAGPSGKAVGSSRSAREEALKKLLTSTPWLWRAGPVETKDYIQIRFNKDGTVSGVYWLTHWEVTGPTTFKVVQMKDPKRYWIFEMGDDKKLAKDLQGKGTLNGPKTLQKFE